MNMVIFKYFCWDIKTTVRKNKNYLQQCGNYDNCYSAGQKFQFFMIIV